MRANQPKTAVCRLLGLLCTHNQFLLHNMLVHYTGDGERSFTHPLHTNNLTLELHFSSNANTDGVFVYRVDKSDIVEPTQSKLERHTSTVFVYTKGFPRK